MDTPLPPSRLTTLQAAQRAWAIRRLYQEGVVDRSAAVLSLDAMAAHDNPRIAGLVRSIVTVGMERPILEPQVESFCR